MRKIRGFTLLILLAVPFSSAQAQNVAIKLLEFSDAAPGGRFNEINCIIPNIPYVSTNLPQVIKLKAEDKIIWCVDVNGRVANTYQYYVVVDGGTQQLLTANCSNIELVPVICVASIPPNLFIELQKQTSHTISIFYHDVVSNANSMTSTISIRRPVCLDAGKVYETDESLPASSVGALRNQVGMYTFETRIGELRANGWFVEWQRVQFGPDSTGLNGYNFLLAWCVGK